MLPGAKPLRSLPFFGMLLLGLQGSGAAQSPAGANSQPNVSPQSHISAAQAKELFRSVDTILQFDAKDTGLAVHHGVKRRLMTRDEVVAFLKQKMDEDKDTARIEQSAIVLEKFGLLPRHFALRPFLLKLLGEQVAGFYDSKTKTVNMLDWIDADTQKPVLAHELTHALQDQYQGSRHIDLDKWENAGPDDPAVNVEQDREHIRSDETDSAREAVLEGQAMVAYLDWGLAGKGQTLRTMPDIAMDDMSDATSKDADSPVLASAPLVLRESLLFPYQDGLAFEQRVLKDRGTQAAFAGALDHPPSTSWEILHPVSYERGEHMPLLAMPDLHPLLDRDWAPYDVGVMGALDVRMLGEALGDKGAGADAALAWNGGLYYAGQARSATTATAKGDTASLALVYLSRWKTPEAAAAFAGVYRGSLPKHYGGLRLQTQAPQSQGQPGERAVYSSEEGPILVARQGRFVFISHSLPVPLAEQVMMLMVDAQTAHGGSESTMPQASVSEPLRHFFASHGIMQAAMSRVY